MFRRLTIRNFRSIKDAEVALGKFTVVVGPNGSGKSNFVDALVFLRELATDGEAAVAARGGISSVVRWSKTRPFDLRMDLTIAPDADATGRDHFRHGFTIRSGREGSWKFHKERIEVVSKGKIIAEVVRSGASAEAKSRNGNWHVTLSEQASALVMARQLALVDERLRRPLLGVRRYRLSPEVMRQPQQASQSAVLLENGANVATVVRKLREKGMLEGTLETMRRVIPGLRDIRTASVGRYEVLEFVQDQAGETAAFSGSDMSEGSMRALGVVLAANQMNSGDLLVIEEPEANVHPGAAALIYDVLESASQRCDVLITTHSPDILDAAKDGTILVCDYRDGVTRIGPLDSGQRQLVRDGLFRLAELMRSEPLRIEGDKPESVDP
jgi:type I restriction enzyme M protein